MQHGLVGLLLLGCVACGERQPDVAASSSSTSIRLEKPRQGWAESIEYRTDAEGVRLLLLDGVEFELRDPGAYRLDWAALGMSGIETTGSFHYESNVPVEGAFLSVSGREVRIVEGALMWGAEAVGTVEEGDRVIVDREGLRLP